MNNQETNHIYPIFDRMLGRAVSYSSAACCAVFWMATTSAAASTIT